MTTSTAVSSAIDAAAQFTMHLSTGHGPKRIDAVGGTAGAAAGRPSPGALTTGIGE
ncbi:MAG: hypothetical protein ACJ74O_18790 [Frankiaceae bacterium]